MRIWDLDPAILCRSHLLGEHRELHGLWNILVREEAGQGPSGYANHPETRRWEGRLKALALRHDALVAEMGRRGYRHASPLDKRHASGLARQDRFVDPPQRQLGLLRAKGCACRVPPPSASL